MKEVTLYNHWQPSNHATSAAQLEQHRSDASWARIRKLQQQNLVSNYHETIETRQLPSWRAQVAVATERKTRKNDKKTVKQTTNGGWKYTHDRCSRDESAWQRLWWGSATPLLLIVEGRVMVWGIRSGNENMPEMSSCMCECLFQRMAWFSADGRGRRVGVESNRS